MSRTYHKPNSKVDFIKIIVILSNIQLAHFAC
mgnify:CR=1 FL=1